MSQQLRDIAERIIDGLSAAGDRFHNLGDRAEMDRRGMMLRYQSLKSTAGSFSAAARQSQLEFVESVLGRAALETAQQGEGDRRFNGTTIGHEPDVLPQGMTFHAGELGDAYVAGAKSGRDNQPTDEQIARACDAYVKLAHLRRAAPTPERDHA